MLLNEFFAPQMNEGGAVFPETVAIKKEYVSDIVKQIKKLLSGMDVHPDIGSAGYKIQSGDMDVMIDAQALADKFGAADVKAAKKALQELLTKKSLDTKLSGQNVHVKMPLPDGTFGQVDIMVIPDAKMVAPYHQHGPRGSYDDPEFKGSEIFILIASVAKSMNLKFEPFGARLVKRDTGDLVARSRDDVARILLNPNATGDDLNSVKSIMNALKDDPKREEKLAQARADAEKGLIKLPESKEPHQLKARDIAKTVAPRPFAGSQPHPFKGKLVGSESKINELDDRDEDNFNIDDIKRLERTPSLDDAKRLAIELITKPSKRPMAIEKQRWLKNAVIGKKDKMSVVKLMYDLMLGGEGMKVIGSKSSYRQKFGEDENPTDKITMDVPLFIRMLEYAREDAKDDMDLHSVTDHAIKLMQQHDYLCMDNYDDLVGGEQAVDEDFQWTNPNLTPDQVDKMNKNIQQTMKNKPYDVDKSAKDQKTFQQRLPQGKETAPMPVYDRNVPSFMPTSKVKPKQYVSASKDIDQTDEGWLDKVYAASRNFADTASLGTAKYGRAGIDWAAKNAMHQLGYADQGTSYQKELDQEIEKLDKDWKQEPGASLAGMGAALAIPITGEYGAAVKGAQGLAGQALDTYGKAVKMYPLAKAALGYKDMKNPKVEDVEEKLQRLLDDTMTVEAKKKNKPTNPELWSRAKSAARSKFEVYPSAYANAWAAKWYKSKGGGWRKG